MPGWPSPPSMRTTALCFGKGSTRQRPCPDRRTHDAGGGKNPARDVGSYVLFMVIADETDGAARAKWEHYKRAPMKKRWRGSPSRVRKIPAPAAIPTCARWPTPPRRSALTWAPWSGSYASVARMLDEVASVPGTDGVLLTFDDFLARH